MRVRTSARRPRVPATFKVPLRTAQQIRILALERGLTQGEVIDEAVALFMRESVEQVARARQSLENYQHEFEVWQ